MPTRVQVNEDAVQTLENKTLAEPVINVPEVIGGTLDGTQMLADPIDPLDIVTLQYLTAFIQNFTTGDIKLTLKIVADAGWVLMDDKSIGDATSGATGRANADTEDLYTLIYDNIIDAWAPVVGGRGANATEDFAAHKAIFLPKTLGRVLAGYGVGTALAEGLNADVDTTNDTLTVLTNTAKWITGMPVVFTLASGTITGLTSGLTYYVIRDSATTVKLASTLANAQNGTAINMTAKSSPVWSILHTYATRVLGEASGEENHAMNDDQLLAHFHGTNLLRENGAFGVAMAAGTGGNSSNSGSTGGNVAMNIMQPTSFLNIMVKL